MKLQDKFMDMVPLIRDFLFNEKLPPRVGENEGLSFLESRILEVIAHENERGLTINELARYLTMKQPNCTRTLKSLKEKNIVLSKVNINDKRSFLLYLSDKGQYLYEEFLKRREVLITEKIDTLSKEEKQKIMKSFLEIEKILKKD